MRELERVVYRGNTTYYYEYKPNGLRLSKTINGVYTTHVWDKAKSQKLKKTIVKETYKMGAISCLSLIFSIKWIFYVMNLSSLSKLKYKPS